MSKMYFLIPSVGQAENIGRDLLEHGVKTHDIGVLGSSEQAFERNAVASGEAGVLAGLDAAIVSEDLAAGGAALMGMPLARTAFGAWASSLIGESVSAHEVARLQDAIQAGEILMIVNPVEISRDEIKSIVSGYLPGVTYGGDDSGARTVA
ncbi:MAG: hypothetical protein H6920_00305 [Sphingomonadaceae bacterium]|nr:hypothetical protein [Sphingomonadaceae bacterium]